MGLGMRPPTLKIYGDSMDEEEGQLLDSIVWELRAIKEILRDIDDILAGR